MFMIEHGQDLGGPESYLRHLALVLHSLHEEDRLWLIEHVDASTKNTVDQYLRELADLGIPRDSNLVNEWLNEYQQSTSEKNEFEGDETTRFVNCQNAALMFSLLKDEPIPCLVATLKLRNWRWESEFIGLFDLLARRELQTSLAASRQISSADASVSKKFNESLLRHLVTAIEHTATGFEAEKKTKSLSNRFVAAPMTISRTSRSPKWINKMKNVFSPRESSNKLY